MALEVIVGPLALDPDASELSLEIADDTREQFEEIYRVLAEHHLPLFVEPSSFSISRSDRFVGRMSYLAISLLKRACALSLEYPKKRTTPLGNEDDGSYAIYEKHYSEGKSHLICHPDSEGYYIPVKFSKVIFDDRVSGGSLVSSLKLFEELVRLAPYLAIKLNNHRLEQNERERLENLITSKSKLAAEIHAWRVLYDACRLSQQLEASIAFC